MAVMPAARTRRFRGWLLGRVVCLLLAVSWHVAHAEPPADRLARLRHGVAITNWFRFPPRAGPAALASYMTDAALSGLRDVGFTVVRLPVQPGWLEGDPARLQALLAAIRRIERHGLAVLVSVHPVHWRLERSAADRAALLAFWLRLAEALRPLDPGLTFPELLNEPVFPAAPEAWRVLQHGLLQQVRARLPQHTIVLSGNDWGSLAGLLALRPEVDPNVIYSFHDYQPAELTSLAAYRSGLDRAVLARLPFPADDRAGCFRLAQDTGDPPTAALIRFYCGLRWNSRRVAAGIDAAADWGRRNHAAVLLGEFGASVALDRTSRLNWLRAVRQQAEADGIGWVLWGYDDVMGFGLGRPPPARPVLDPGVLQALGLAPA